MLLFLKKILLDFFVEKEVHPKLRYFNKWFISLNIIVFIVSFSTNQIYAQYDLNLTQTVSTTQGDIGDTLDFELSVNLQSGNLAKEIEVIDSLSGGLELINLGNPSNGGFANYNRTTRQIYWQLGELNKSVAVAKLRFSARIIDGPICSNHAEITKAIDDVDSKANNKAYLEDDITVVNISIPLIYCPLNQDTLYFSAPENANNCIWYRIYDFDKDDIIGQADTVAYQVGNEVAISAAGNYFFTSDIEGCFQENCTFLEIKEGCMDLALTKQLADHQSLEVKVGDAIDYQICIINEGNLTAYNVSVVDRIPNGLAFEEADNNEWVVVNNNLITKKIANPIEPNEQVCFGVKLVLISGQPGANFTNTAEIFDQTDEQGNSIQDVDSTPDIIEGNETTEEDDHDFATFTLLDCPVLQIIPAEISICQGTSVQLTLNEINPTATYKWTPSYGLSNPFIANPVANPPVSTHYIVEVDQGSGGCISYDTVIVRVFDVPNPDFRSNTVCVGETTLFDDETVTYTNLTGWFWDFGDEIGTSTEQNPTYVYQNAGQYFVKLIVESTNNCRDSIIKEVIVHSGAQAVTHTGKDTICIGECIELIGEGGTTFSWSPSNNLNHTNGYNPIACPVETTTYHLEVTNEFGCTSSDSIIITVIPEPTVTITMTDITECGSYNGIISISTNSLENGLEYSIDGGLTYHDTPVFTNLPASSYLVVVKSRSCIIPYSNNPVIIGQAKAPVISAVPTKNPSCEAADGSITIQANGAVNLVYSINGGINWVSDNEFTDLDGGIYYIAVASADLSCRTYYPPITLVKPEAPVFTEIHFTNPSDCEQNDGTVSIMATGTKSIEYGLNNGLITQWQSSNNFINLPAGIYGVYIRNIDDSCVTTDELENIQLEAPMVPIINTVEVIMSADCDINNGQINITATTQNATLEYSIDGGINWGNFAVFEDLRPATYNIFVRNQGGTCEVAHAENPIEISFPKEVQILEVLHENPTDCDKIDGQIEITARGNTTDLLYSINAGITWQDSNRFTGLSGGIYNVRVTNSNQSCPLTYPTLELIAPTSGTIDTIIANRACKSGAGSLSIITTHTESLEYSIDGGVTFQTSNTFLNLLDGRYTIFIRNINDQCTVEYEANPVIINGATDSGNLGIDNVLTVEPTDCGAADGSISINARGNRLVYSIDGGINFTNTNGDFDNLLAGIYNIFIKDLDSGCEIAYIFNPIELLAPEYPTITTVEVSHLSDCHTNDASITIITADPDYLQYSLDGSNWSNEHNFYNLLPGLYNAWVRNEQESCAVAYANNPIIITIPTGPIITDCIGTNPTDCDVNDGILTILAVGGQGILQYSIDDGKIWQRTNQFKNLAAGIYSVIVANADKTCQTTHPLCILTSPEPPVINAVRTFAVSQCNKNNGAITILADGTDALEYSIDGGINWSANSFFVNLPANTYAVMVRNASDNCQIEYGAVTLDAPDTPTIIKGMNDTTTCIGNAIPVSITISENITQYTISGSGGYLNATIQGPTLTFDGYLNGASNDFLVTFETTDGCTVVDKFIIAAAAVPEAAFIIQNQACAETEVSIIFTGEASPDAQLNWNLAGATILSSSPATATTPAGAALTVKWSSSGGKTLKLDIDDKGCTDRTLQNINVHKQPFANAGVDITICEGECVSLNGFGNGSQYQWTPAIGLSATDIPTPLACPSSTTTYQLLVMGADDCMTMDEVTIFVEKCEAAAIICTEEIVAITQETVVLEMCDQEAKICLDLPLAEIFNYSLQVNGEIYTNNFEGCNYDTTYAYTYYTLPNKGKKGNYRLHSWVINGQNYSGQFESILELIQKMNEWDSQGNWRQNEETLTIIGGIPSNTYGQIHVEQINTGAMAFMELNVHFIPLGTILSFPLGTNEVTITNNTTQCEDYFTVFVDCKTAPKIECDDFITETAKDFPLINCEEKASFCVEIPINELGIYAIGHNGSIYTGLIETCIDSSSIQLYAGEGKHHFSFTNELTTCSEDIIITVSCLKSVGNKAPTVKDRVHIKDAETAIKIFTGFSPNRDGINDFFRIEGLTDYPENELRVYNQLGQLLFIQQNYKNDWDGRVDGEVLPNSTYLYILSDGKGKRYSGYLQLNR